MTVAPDLFGKRGFVGIACDALIAVGSELAITYLNEKAKPYRGVPGKRRRGITHQFNP